MKTLKDQLTNWTDTETAMFYVGQHFGLFDDTYHKWVFWSNNPTSRMLYNVLEQLHQLDVLEKRDEPDYQYRWNSSFVGDWGKKRRLNLCQIHSKSA